MKSKLLIGSHVKMCTPDYLLGSVNEAISYGANCFMIYTGAPQNTIRTDINKLKINEFKKELEQNCIDINNVIIHAPYIVNLATSNPSKHEYAVNVLTNELNRTIAIGAKYIVFHPGNAVDCDPTTAINNIANGINQILANVNNQDVVICLETMSGKGTEIGRTFEQLSQIINLVKNKENVGVCLDTCHINDAGYNLNDFDQILDQFDQIIGLNKLKVIHLNDSINPINSHKDRHENIGYGTIGFKNLLNVVNNKRILSIPKILETPYYHSMPIYKYEIEMLNTGKWFDVKSIIDNK